MTFPECVNNFGEKLSESNTPKKYDYSMIDEKYNSEEFRIVILMLYKFTSMYGR